MLKEGSYEVKVMDAGITEGKNHPQAWMKMGNETDYITWYGSMSEKAAKYTAEALVKAGFVGDDFDDLSLGMTNFKPQLVNIVVADEEYNNKITTKVKYINTAGSGPKTYAGATPKFAGVFAAAKKELGVGNDELNF